jgi:hypothetical protein
MCVQRSWRPNRSELRPSVKMIENNYSMHSASGDATMIWSRRERLLRQQANSQLKRTSCARRLAVVRWPDFRRRPSVDVLTIHFAIEPELCGPVSIGTVRIISLLRDHLGLSLSDAKAIVDRCVFEGEHVAVPAPTRDAADRLVRALAALPSVPRVCATVHHTGEACE